jgi:predicted dehydrogenase
VIGEVKTMYLNDEFPLSHRLDLVHFFLGDADHVWAREEDLPQGSHAPRGAMLHVVARNGKEAFTPVGWDEKLAPEILEFTGDKGVLRIDDLKAGKITIRVDNSERTEDVGPLPNTHWGLVDNFVKYQNGLAPLACDGVEGRKSTVILDIVQELQPDNKAIPVQYD